jgi:ABC-type uncharacterized transport system YnjBCD ATPase subunit
MILLAESGIHQVNCNAALLANCAKLISDEPLKPLQAALRSQERYDLA